MGREDQQKFQEATVKHWNVWLENDAVDVLDLNGSWEVEQKLTETNELDRIVDSRLVLTDKNDGLRTDTQWLPLEPSARLVIPGFKVKEHLEGTVRRDAPTGNRNSQHLLFTLCGGKSHVANCKRRCQSRFLEGRPL